MSDESCCTKKQKEVDRDGKQIDRCVNPKSQLHLAVVSNTACSMCPVRAACRNSKPPTEQPLPIAPDYPFCDHRIWKDNKATCGVTGLPVDPDQCNRCDEETRDRLAKMPDMLMGYASAIRRWIAAGRPTRSKEEQQAILDDHCLKCEMYDHEKHSCKNCGCSLAQTGNPLTSKLAMGTEKCPLGRWE